MKKIIFLLFTLFFSISFTGCMSLIMNAMPPSKGYNFKGDCCEPAWGYETFKWGTRLDTMRQKTGWNINPSNKDYYVIGDSEVVWGDSYFAHGDGNFYVNKTRLYFTSRPQVSYDFNGSNIRTYYKYDNTRLYAVEDEFKKTPSMEQLHSRYGKFSEKNIVTTEQKAQGIQTVYKGQNYLEVGDFTALKIQIYKDGRTIVNMREPFYKACRTEKWNDTWLCYPSIDVENSSIVKSYKKVNFTFLNHKNKDGKILFIKYSKGFENPSISSVRAGICWLGSKYDNKKIKEQEGFYEIKGDKGRISKNYKYEKWNCFYNNIDYLYTNNVGESSRELVELITTSEKVVVRHNDITEEFACNGEQLLEKMAEYGISWEEIDTALLNEEF